MIHLVILFVRIENYMKISQLPLGTPIFLITCYEIKSN